MKVLIPCTDANSTQSGLYIPYGQAPFFALWDSATDQLEFQTNPLAGQAHACACSTTHWMQRAGAEVLITGDMGRRAAQRLTEAGIEVWHAPAGNLGELLALYHHGNLSPAPTGEPRWLGNGPHHTERHEAHCRGGESECCGTHEGRQP
jgi:predicted Fe-Mo cluster-binding NifX family protein